LTNLGMQRLQIYRLGWIGSAEDVRCTLK